MGWIFYTFPIRILRKLSISLDVFCIELNVCNVIVKKERNFDFDFSTQKNTIKSITSIYKCWEFLQRESTPRIWIPGLSQNRGEAIVPRWNLRVFEMNRKETKKHIYI